MGRVLDILFLIPENHGPSNMWTEDPVIPKQTGAGPLPLGKLRAPSNKEKVLLLQQALLFSLEAPFLYLSLLSLSSQSRLSPKQFPDWAHALTPCS